MKKFEQLTIKQVKKEIIAWETDMGTEPKRVEVIGVVWDPMLEPYEQGDGLTCEQFRAGVIIDGKLTTRCYEWCCDEEDITSEWDADVEEN